MLRKNRRNKAKRNPVTILLSVLALILSLLFAYNLATAITECRPYVSRATEVSQFEYYFTDGWYGTIVQYANSNQFTTDTPDADPTHIYAFKKSLDYRMLSLAYSAGPGRDEKKSREYLDLYSAEAASIDRYRYRHALEQLEDYITR